MLSSVPVAQIRSKNLYLHVQEIKNFNLFLHVAFCNALLIQPQKEMTGHNHLHHLHVKRYIDILEAERADASFKR